MHCHQFHYVDPAMKRSEINQGIRDATLCFQKHGWALPPAPRWDVTDFGLGRFDDFGLILINLAEEPEYCEKLMFAYKGQRTPAHMHKAKKEDIICRHGVLEIQLWETLPEDSDPNRSFTISVNGQLRKLHCADTISLNAGERITLCPGIYHEFWPSTDETIIGEVSTANDDLNDNFFVDAEIGRFPGIEEDEPVLVRLVSELDA